MPTTYVDSAFHDDAAALEADLVGLRRELHAAVEIGLDLPRTQAIVLRELEPLGIEVTTGTSTSSVTAILRGGRPGPVVLLRADMDGLPITEATGLEFAATDGAMHACGHDLHMAGLLGAARILTGRREELPGTVVFMFQPGEEGYAGAAAMIEEGVLDAAGPRAVAAYALHVDCAAERGTVLTRQGAMMASVSALRMTVRGTGGHAAYPHLALDPVPVAAEIVLAIQSFVARRTAPTDPTVISVTRVVSDSAAGNVLASTVSMEANIRTLSRETLEMVRVELPALVRSIGDSHRCEVTTEFIDSYPVTYNDPAETRFAIEAAGAVAGADRVLEIDAPSMASEDFAYVLEQVPGAMLFVGARPVDVAAAGAPSLHTDRAVFDDDVLPLQAELLAELAWRRLQG